MQDSDALPSESLSPDAISDPTAPIAAGDMREVARGVYVIANPVPFKPGFQNSYLLADEAETAAPAGPKEPVWTLIDPGFARTAEHIDRRIKAFFEGSPDAKRRVARVIATHHHPDHIGGAPFFMEQDGATFLTTRTAWFYARMLQLDSSLEPKEEQIRVLLRAGYDEAMLQRWRDGRKHSFADITLPLPLGYQRLQQGEAIEIGGREWRVLIGHGHAPEHMLLHFPGDENENGLLLAGDQVLPKISPNISVYPIEPEADPLGDWLESCAELAKRFKEAPKTLVLPGHGDPFFDPAHRLERIIVKHEAALDRLAAWLEEPRTVIDCFEAIFRRAVADGHESLAVGETLAHLNHLRAQGRVERRMRPDGVHEYQKL